MHKPGKKKILVALPHSGGGGDTQCILNLLGGMSNNDLSFYFLINQIGLLHQRFDAYGEVITFPVDRFSLVRRFLRKVSIPFYSWIKTWYFKSEIRRLNPELVYINTVNPTELTQAVLELEYKFVIHPHELDFVVTHRINTRWLKNALDKAQKLISPARAASDFYRDIFGVDHDKILLLHETVDFENLQQQADWNLRQLLAISDDMILIGMSGSLIYRKGIDLFIRTAEIILKTHRNIAFIWMGGSLSADTHDISLRPLWEMIKERQLEQHCFFIPYQNSVRGFYEHIDIFLLTSRIEAFPLVILEAMLFENPVVAMDVGGVREVVDSDTGYLVKDRTPEGLAEGLVHFLNNPQLAKLAGQNGKKRVQENFEAKIQSKKWLDILNSL